MHRRCLHGPINSYHSFWWNNLIFCLYNVDTLDICMKEFGSFLTKWQLWEQFSLIRLLYMHRRCLHGPINSYHSFWWSNLILCLYNMDILNIFMKEAGWKKKIWQNDSYENLDKFSLIRLFGYAWIVPSWADQLLPQLLMEQFDTLPIQCRHIELMHEGFMFRRIIFDKMTAMRTKIIFPI